MTALFNARGSPLVSWPWWLTVGLGVLAWGASLPLLSHPGWPESMLLLAALVVVPLGLVVVARTGPDVRPGWSWRAASWLRFPATLALAYSFVRPAGGLAVLLATPWLAVTLLVAVDGFARLLRGPRGAGVVAAGVGMAYLAVGGVWTVIARAGWRPLGFPDVIVLMTGVHFHYAGFALPVLVGRAADDLEDTLSRVTVVGVLAGVPLVAVGIADAQVGHGLLPPHRLEFLAAVVMAASGLLAATLQGRLALRPGRPTAVRALLFVSGLALPAPMALAGLYALGNSTHLVHLDLDTMFRAHGAVNALGFSVPGLTAWALDRGRAMRTETHGCD